MAFLRLLAYWFIYNLKMKLPWLKLQPKNNAWNDITEDVFRIAFENSSSFAEVLRVLNLRHTARRSAQVPQIAKYLGLDPTRFDVIRYQNRCNGGGENWLGADHHLRKKSARGKFGSLRKSLLERGRPHICESCNQPPEWNGKQLVLQLDHKNGDKFDDREENLRFLCPNCHSQTDTFAGRNIKKRKLCPRSSAD